MKEHRAYVRKNVRWNACIVMPEGVLACVVNDLSLGGARVGLETWLQKKRRVRLEIEKRISFNADVVWRGIGMVGLRFTDDPSYITGTIGPLLSQSGPAS
jgi:hypothetical protein